MILPSIPKKMILLIFLWILAALLVSSICKHMANAASYTNEGIKKIPPVQSISTHNKTIESEQDALLHLSLCKINSMLMDYASAVNPCKRSAEYFEAHDKGQTVMALSYLGIAYAWLGRRGEEIEVYKKVIEIDPNNRDAYYMIAFAYLELKQYDKAIKTCNDGLKRGLREQDLYEILGTAYFDSQDYNNAVKAYMKAIELVPNRTDIFVDLGRALQRARRYTEAIEALSLAFERNPKDTRTLMLLGDTYEEMGKSNEAENIRRKLIEIEPQYIRGYYYLAKTYENLKQYEEAINTYRMGIIRYPNDDSLYHFLVTLHIEMKNYENAISAFRFARKLNPNRNFEDTNLGRGFYLGRKYDEAVEVLSLVLEKNPYDVEALELLGDTYEKIGKHDKARDVWKKLTAIEPPYNYLVHAYIQLKRYKEATEVLLSVLEKNPVNAEALTLLGDTYEKMDKYDKARDVRQKLIEIEPRNEKGYMNQISAYRWLRRYEDAINASKKLISISPSNLYAHFSLGHLYMEMKEYEKAITEFLLAKQFDEGYFFANDVSSAYLALKKYDQAIAVLKEAITLKPDNYENYFKLAEVYSKANLWDDAKEALQAGLARKPDAIGDLQLVCTLWASLGKFSDCVKLIENALGICRKNKDLLCEADAIFQNGYVNLMSMEELSAEINFAEALRIYRELGSKKNEIFAISGLITTYKMQSRSDKVRAALELKLALAKEMGNSGSVIETLAEFAESAETDQEKKSYAIQAINLAKGHDMDGDHVLYEAYRTMAILSHKSKDHTSGLQFEDKSDKIVEISDSALFKAVHEARMGHDLQPYSGPEKAAVRYRRAYELASEINYLPTQAIALCGLGNTNIALGKTSEAKDNLILCTEGLEEVTGKLHSLTLKQMFFMDMEENYEALIGLLVKSGEIENAFNRAERAKARALLDSLGGRFDPQQSARSRVLRLRALQAMILALEEKLQKLPKQVDPMEDFRSRNVEMELESAKSEYTSLLDEIKRDNPEEYSLLSVSASNLKEVMTFLDPDTTLLEYFVATDQTYVWVVDNNGFKLVQVAINKEELEKRVNGYREKIATFDPDYRDDAEALYDLLLNPVMPHVKNKRLIIVPHGALNHLPFHALMTSKGNERSKKGRFLIEDYDVAYAPSASVLRFIYEKRKPLTGKILALGNPYLDEKGLELPYAEEEVKRIKSAYPQTTVFLQKQATKTRVQNLASSYNAIHFATHAELQPDSPMSSSIKLAKEGSNDGNLRVYEVFGLDLKNTSMVTLSGCETGLGKSAGGDEFVGLSRAFIYAGVPTIVASLWKVNDQSTAELMTLFYQNLKTVNKAEALRKAQIEMIKGDVGAGIVRGVGGITMAKKAQTVPVKESLRTVDGSHPYFWAPFILIGDWK
jgi:CHAT domain-containing protein/tetratricopeptide (TPR) repeat protein